MSDRSITRPPSKTQCPAGLFRPPRTATSHPVRPGKVEGDRDILVATQRAITAGRRITNPLKQRRAAS